MYMMSMLILFVLVNFNCCFVCIRVFVVIENGREFLRIIVFDF